MYPLVAPQERSDLGAGERTEGAAKRPEAASTAGVDLL